MDIILETEKVIKLIGPAVYKLAEDFYYSAEPTGDHLELMEHIQLPIAIAAVSKYNQQNILSHEDVGRKLKLDKTKESIGWEWMYDRDDEAHERKAFSALDRLINFLDASGLAAWQNSDARKSTKRLFINNTAVFERTYPIDDSGRFYYKLVPFIDEIERNAIKDALGSIRYKSLLQWFQSTDPTDTTDEEVITGGLDNNLLLALIRDCVPLLTMAVAVQRFSLSILPEGVVQQFRSMSQGRNASQAVLEETRQKFIHSLQLQADKKLDKLKKYIRSADVDASNYDLLPNNPCGQKFFRT